MKNPIPNLSEENTVRERETRKPNKLLLPAVLVLVVGLGVFTGFYLSKVKGKGSFSLVGGVVPQGKLTVGSEFGSKDLSKFKDTAMGVLEAGGLDGEGTHKLLREGGPSQTVYLTSSVLDLDQFTGKKIQIWGETFKAQKAGWLMDVGRIKILE